MTPRLLLTTALAVSLFTTAQAGDLTVSNLTFKIEAPWTEVPTTSPMRAGTAQFTVEGTDTKLDAVFYYFGAGQGGDTQANIARWLSQFESPPKSRQEELAAGDKKVTLVIADGTYLDGPPFGGAKTPRADWTLLGAIVPAEDANIFIKLTGPKDAVSKALDSFKKLVTSPF
ncbi:MAG: hypothetical protein KDK99_15740 [Verrucomicrobiales bacterium]|nr:hypothetical protein [Verrucomicrobiales bacterium]